MMAEVMKGVLLPFAGTALGAGSVFFLHGAMNELLRRALAGFAAGVMVAASMWSLLIPAIEQSAGLGQLAFLPAAAGFWAGIAFLLLIDHLVPQLPLGGALETRSARMSKTSMLLFAVTLHNLPEGMAVGVIYAGWRSGSGISLMEAVTLALGIAVQNIPEGAIISMPLRAEGMARPKAFLYGVLSGAVEPVGALVTIAAAGLIVPILPYLLSFAAGAMLYVVVEELVPEMSEGRRSDVGPLLFALGFTLMMTLDVALG